MWEGVFIQPKKKKVPFWYYSYKSDRGPISATVTVLPSSSHRPLKFHVATREKGFSPRPRGLMDKASDFGSEDCEFESRRGQKRFYTRSIDKPWTRLETIISRGKNLATFVCRLHISLDYLQTNICDCELVLDELPTYLHSYNHLLAVSFDRLLHTKVRRRALVLLVGRNSSVGRALD